ncbi:hypothetical protein [Legionella rowbothamii]|uniref:hypothetical protein n=1 Tax=Legionella rowbothamii TaxID=96229 RepID=UPI001055474B|nr:hypothetical protein [Legionella rowbothamii]
MIKITKCPIPIVWLDTSVMLLLTKLNNNPHRLNESELKNISLLSPYLEKGVLEGKILIPISEQGLEIIGEDKNREWFDTMQSITLGILASSSWDIENIQTRAGMKSYLANKKEICLSYLDYFDYDPVVEMRETLARQIVIYPSFNPFIQSMQTQESIKRDLITSLNQERANNIQQNIEYQQQFNKELNQRYNTLLEQNPSVNLLSPLDFLLSSTYKIWDLLMWCSLNNNDLTAINELKAFYNSPYYKELPHVALKCALLAKMKTSKNEIKSGDLMDIQHTADMLSVSDLYITDKKWSAFLKEQKFDAQYKTKIIYIGDSEEIISFFEKLG